MSREILFYSDFAFGYHNREAEEKMARFAARGYRVQYVEQLGIRNPSPRNVLELVRRVRPGRARAASGAPVPFDVVSPKLLPPRRAPLVDGLNRRWLTRQLRSRVENPERAILWVRYPTPELIPLVEDVPWALVVYELVDDHERSPGMTRRLASLYRASEARVLTRAGVVFAWSEPIRERLAGLHENVVLAPAGVELETFAAIAASPVPEGAVAMYVGSLDFRFDAELVAEVSRRLADWTLVVAGPVSDGAGRALAGLPNVKLLGRVAPDEVAQLLGSASVCLMPYRRGSFADMLFPIKLVEYLAAGRPVVSTGIRASRELADVVTIADGATAFAEGIRAAAAADSVAARQRRVARARPFSWDRRIDEMQAAIEAALAHG